MTSDHREDGDGSRQHLLAGNIANAGEPIRFDEVGQIDGFAGSTANKGQEVKVFTRLALTSDEPSFHHIANAIAHMIRAWVSRQPVAFDISDYKFVLLLLKPDKTAELWLDTAAVALKCIAARDVVAGAAVFQHEIADLISMEFPCVEFGKQDKVLCLFRQAWGFGLAFDMIPSGDLKMEAFNRELGRLYRQLNFRHLYDVVGNPESLDQLMACGWFPFVEILHREFADILAHHAGGLVLDEVESSIVATFDQARLDHMLSRWMQKPHFAVKKALLSEGIEAFIQRRPIAAIKILVTEIEGILNGAYRALYGKAGKTKALLAFAIESAEARTGGPGTLFLTTEFNRYLLNYTFASYDPDNLKEGTVSRHVVGHGDADSESYTLVKALQVILTLDQLAFYT